MPVGTEHSITYTTGPMAEPASPTRSDREEFWNGTTHAIGFALSVLFAAILIPRSATDSTWEFTAMVLFCVLLILVYLFSSLSHFVRQPRQQSFCRRLDQAFIFLLITSSYMPFSVVYQHGRWWWLVLSFMWTVSIVGFVSKLVYSHRVNKVAIWIYLLLGWTPFVAGMPFAGLVPMSFVISIIVGGLLYSIGTIFLVLDRKVWYFHAIWHLFVIAGSAVHCLAIYQLLTR